MDEKYTDEQIVAALMLMSHLNVCREAYGLINRQKAEIDHFRKVTKKVKTDLKYYLDTNEENGVVWIPKFTVNNLAKEMTEDGK